MKVLKFYFAFSRPWKSLKNWLYQKSPWKSLNCWMSEILKINMSKEFTTQLFLSKNGRKRMYFICWYIFRRPPKKSLKVLELLNVRNIKNKYVKRIYHAIIFIPANYPVFTGVSPFSQLEMARKTEHSVSWKFWLKSKLWFSNVLLSGLWSLIVWRSVGESLQHKNRFSISLFPLFRHPFSPDFFLKSEDFQD